jgi:hypothetical protein
MTKEQLREKALALGIAKSEINKCTNKAQIEELIAKVESPKTVTDTSDDDAAVLLGGEPTTAAGPVPSEEPLASDASKAPAPATVPEDSTGPAQTASAQADATPESQPVGGIIGYHPVTGKPVYHVVD